ncbi:hypothetical protein [Pseudosporangium ferrugineum]|uniref:Transposase DDE domain-containing protein n=1 Tax=Pseudosporangium ferrugineum TaxID=439699 RepID=A0A2T0S933_9ACTN|nr:hypothetical protein [Pseudosporangium ferrugineum]PRY29939.1 hypothetical protein CLV70_105107 [Pseudosporangium ferrugineum]
MIHFSASAVAAEVWLAAAYCLTLVGLAYVIDGLARRAAAVSEGGLSGGFVYHSDHDAWQCPQDQWLWPRSFDAQNRVMRYRATPSVCNACPVRDTCTTSPSGREVQRAVDSWPASESARFYRGLACTVVAFGLVWPVGTALTGPGSDSLLVLCVAVIAALLLSLPLWSHLRRTPVFIPEGVVHRSLDDAVAEREAAASELTRRRSSYGSDRRGPGPEAAR